MHWQILDAAGKIVATAEAEPQSDRGGRGHVHGHRQPARTLPLVAGDSVPLFRDCLGRIRRQVHDAERVAFGVRTLLFDAHKGFFLNGKSVKIKGTCNHQDHAGVGAALPDRLQWYRLAVLRRWAATPSARHTTCPHRNGWRPATASA